MAHTVERFREAGVRIIAGIMNDMDFSKSSYIYYSPYQYYSHNHSYPPDADGKQAEGAHDEHNA